MWKLIKNKFSDMEYLRAGEKFICKLNNEYKGRVIEITDEMLSDDENILEFLHYFGFELMGETKLKHPELVTKLTTLCSGWLVGSSANPDITNPRDYDVYIPMKFWLEASSYIPKEAKINRMGGFKCISEGVEVDVWTGDINDFLSSDYFSFAYQPKTGVRIGRIKS